MRAQPLFESWTLSSHPIPARSRLYALEPVGVGTPLVESLSGYVARLAEAHSVSVGDLVGLVLSDIPNPKGTVIPPAAKAGRRGGHGFRVCSYTINGVTERAMTWVHALEAATSRHDLQYLTLLPFRRALPDHLFHRHRAWCSLCYEQWRLNSQTVYEPLLWAIKTSSYCLVHQRPLSHDCPHCGRSLNPLSVFSRPGYCERCGGWLGSPHADRDQPPPAEENQTWTCTEVGSLLPLLPLVDAVAARESLRRTLTVYLEEVAGGNVLAFTDYTRCPGPMLHSWLAGAAVPRLENLLRISRYLNVPLSSFFTLAGPTSTDIAAAKQAVSLCRKHRASRSRQRSEIRRALLTAIDAAVLFSVIDIARRLGYTTTDSLYKADRTLCYKITARYRQLGGRHRWKKLGVPRASAFRAKELLERSLNSTESISVHQIAASLGRPNDKYIQRDFPELCTAITKKIAEAKQDRLERMRWVLRNALAEQPTPTLTDLSRRLGYPHTAVLRRHESTLCDQLLSRYKDSVAKYVADLEKEAIVALGEIPVPSLRAICRRLGITVPFMNKHFPGVARMIVEQHRRHVSAEAVNRHELLLRGIPHIAAELHSRGLYPSVERILERLPEKSRRDWKTITFAVREAHKALGILR